MKISAAEAIWETEDPADFVVVASIDEKNQENPFRNPHPKGAFLPAV